ncbi:MAG: hypothetical protein ACYC91_14735 [Solirubrobacteraceae bacterium]
MPFRCRNHAAAVRKLELRVGSAELRALLAEERVRVAVTSGVNLLTALTRAEMESEMLNSCGSEGFGFWRFAVD